MASRLGDLAGRVASNPRGVGGGATALVLAGGAAYGVYNSLFQVEGGHRAIMFNRITGVQQDIYREGLHFRVPLPGSSRSRQRPHP